MSKVHTNSVAIPKRSLLLVIILGLASYAVLPQLGSFSNTFTVLRHARTNFIAVATLCVAFTYLLAALSYCLLSWRPLAYGRTLLVQVASMFVNRLLPAGLGALGANYLYLRHERNTAPQAASAVTANNVLGFTGHLLLLMLFALFGVVRLPSSWRFPVVQSTATLLVVSVGVMLAALVIRWQQAAVTRFFRTTLQQLAAYRRRPGRLLAVLGTAMLLTLANVACVLCCAHAVGISLQPVQIFIAFTVSIGAGSVAPTPGGLGAVEAGLLAGLLAYHVTHGPALACVLLFRLLTFWLGLIVGAGAFAMCQHKRLFTAK